MVDVYALLIVSKCQTAVWQEQTVHFILAERSQRRYLWCCSKRIANTLNTSEDIIYCNKLTIWSWLISLVLTCYQEEHEVGWWSALPASWTCPSWCPASGSLSTSICSSSRTSASLEDVGGVLTTFVHLEDGRIQVYPHSPAFAGSDRQLPWPCSSM